jgi:hypothetical protein
VGGNYTMIEKNKRTIFKRQSRVILAAIEILRENEPIERI